ncbi:hypothetical protein Rhe02_84950 [Rhizocola hellebori]|uniref:Uncharacterized protein n=1 Tax=Rhizocola hellebori TaxID=1392758 RepID=A0A8J3QGG0_9ACTN|nr:hypothetical protein Rhe02_84950 [Rhizocola hellebori]
MVAGLGHVGGELVGIPRLQRAQLGAATKVKGKHAARLRKPAYVSQPTRRDAHLRRVAMCRRSAGRAAHPC